MSNLSDEDLTRVMDGFSLTHFKHRLCSALLHENTESVVRMLNLKLHEESCVSSSCCCIKGFLSFEAPLLPFGGVFPSDRLPPHQTENVCYIFNTDPSTKPGEHWVAYYQVDGHAEFFDSFGYSAENYPPIYMWLLQGPFHPVRQLSVRYQGPSMLCGPYCLYFLNERPSYPNMTTTFDSACFPFRKLQRGEDSLLSKEELKRCLGLNDAYVFSYLSDMVNRFLHSYKGL